MTQTPSETPSELGNDDPRMGFAKVTEAVGALIEQTTNDQLGLPTPCTEFDVLDLLNHIQLVMERVAVLGNGGHWSEVTEESTARDGEHAEAFGSTAHDVMGAWTDASKLEQTYEVPWGELPGAPLMYTYTAELATHGWDLATATDQEFAVPDDALTGALVSIKMIPEDGRGHPDMPFDPVVRPAEDAPVLLHIAGWAGRAVV